MTEYKIYGLKDPTDKMIKYVGVTKNIETRYKQHLYCKNQKNKYQWVEELRIKSLRPEMVIFETINTDDRNVALNKEKEYIALYKENILNIDGTDNPKSMDNETTTIQITLETRDKLNEFMLQIKKTRLSYNEIIEELITMTKK